MLDSSVARATLLYQLILKETSSVGRVNYCELCVASLENKMTELLQYVVFEAVAEVAVGSSR